MKKSGFFWVGYADLMTSLFFIMLVLYVISFALFKQQINYVEKGKRELEKTVKNLDETKKLLQEQAEYVENAKIELEKTLSEFEKTKKLLLVQAEKVKIIEAVEQNLEPLKNDKELFIYDDKYKRFNLAFDVQFKYGRSKINSNDLANISTIDELLTVGRALENIIKKLKKQKEIDLSKFGDISYLIVVSGSASDFGEKRIKNYSKSYERAYYLYQFWKENGIDLDAKKYHELVEFQIAGNGTGGVGRLKDEKKNQRFIINIIPKIGEVN